MRVKLFFSDLRHGDVEFFARLEGYNHVENGLIPTESATYSGSADIDQIVLKSLFDIYPAD